MLNFGEKYAIFKNYLLIEEDNYGDVMKLEIYNYLIENESKCEFLNSIGSKQEIEQKVESIVSKMIMHEHEDGLDNIIEFYL